MPEENQSKSHESPSARKTGAAAGFIMVELALAIVVLTIGVLSVYSLFSSGLNLSREASADTQSALFAEAVMKGLRAESEKASASDSWESFGSTTNPLPVAASGPDGIWDPELAVWADGLLHTNVYTNWPLHDANVTNVISRALRYTLTIEGSNRRSLTLHVWEGAFGTTNETDRTTYYTEFNDPGTL